MTKNWWRALEFQKSKIAALLCENKWRTFELKDAWTYSNNGIPMITVCGLMRLRVIRPWSSPEEAIRLHEIELELK